MTYNLVSIDGNKKTRKNIIQVPSNRKLDEYGNIF